MTLQAAEKLDNRLILYQGTTLVVPQMTDYKRWALAPEGRFFSIFDFHHRLLSDVCSGFPGLLIRQLNTVWVPHPFARFLCEWVGRYDTIFLPDQ
jgi:hypothetical protein